MACDATDSDADAAGRPGSCSRRPRDSSRSRRSRRGGGSCSRRRAGSWRRSSGRRRGDGWCSGRREGSSRRTSLCRRRAGSCSRRRGDSSRRLSSTVVVADCVAVVEEVLRDVIVAHALQVSHPLDDFYRVSKQCVVVHGSLLRTRVSSYLHILGVAIRRQLGVIRRTLLVSNSETQTAPSPTVSPSTLLVFESKSSPTTVFVAGSMRQR